MIHKAWNSKKEASYCFSRSSVKFQGRMGQNIANFDPNWAFPDCSSSLNLPIDLKWSTKLDIAEKRFFKVLHQISRSRGLKNWWFESNWSKITRPVAAIKSLRFALFFLNNYLGDQYNLVYLISPKQPKNQQTSGYFYYCKRVASWKKHHMMYFLCLCMI